MDRRAFVAALAGSVMLPLPAGLFAQGQGPVRRIGHLSAFSRPDIETFVALLRPELDKLGWTEGRNLVLLEVRTTEGRNERLPALAAELVAQRPDLVLVQSAPATRDDAGDDVDSAGDDRRRESARDGRRRQPRQAGGQRDRLGLPRR
jgi:putative ABC transport system substrate-binding protein